MSETHPPKPQSNLGLSTFLGFVVSILYAAPIYLICVAIYASDGLQENSTTFAWFATFMNSADSTLNQFHKILFPILAGISALAVTGKPSKGVMALGAFLLMSFTVTIWVSVYFDMESTKNSLQGLEVKLDPNLAKAFFGKVQESLLTYFALLFGLSIAGAKRAGETK